MGKYILAWFPMLGIAILNGVLRQDLYGPHMGDLAAHQLSSLSAIALFAVYMGLLFRKWPTASAAQALRLGLIWLGMTVAFEFLFGHYVAGHGWDRLLHDYHLWDGRLWVLVLAWIGTGPWLIHRARQ